MGRGKVFRAPFLMITGIIGKGRAGKSTYSAYLIWKDYKRYNRYYNIRKPFFRSVYRRFFPFHDYRFCTDETFPYCDHITYDDLGKWNVPDNSLIVLEECGLGFNNRKWKSFSDDALRLVALIGHKKSDIVWSSQTADVDLALRVRTHNLFLISRSFSHFSYVEPIEYDFDVADGSLQCLYTKSQGFARIRDFFTRRARLFWRKPYYHLFDSYSDSFKYPLPVPSDLAPVIEI